MENRRRTWLSADARDLRDAIVSTRYPLASRQPGRLYWPRFCRSALPEGFFQQNMPEAASQSPKEQWDGPLLTPDSASSARLEVSSTSHGSEEGSEMKLNRVGVDLARQVFQVHGVDRAERSVW